MSEAQFTDERLREALREVVEVAGDGGGCPDTDRLVASGRGELEPRDERDVLLHIGRCTACAAAWRIARDVAAPAEPLRFSVRTRSSVPQRWYRLAAAAVLCAAAVGLGVIYWPSGKAPVPIYRAPEGQSLRSTVDADEPLPREHFVLRWTAGPEGTFYDLRVLGARLEPLVRVEGLDRPEYTVRAEALEQLPAGTRVLWQVTAHLPDGQRIESETFFAVIE
jgi:hypothetical protein